MKVHCRKSSTAEVPLQKSAATTARMACEIGAPSTSGRSARYQIAPGPGTPKRPRAARIDMPVDKRTGGKARLLLPRLIWAGQFDRDIRDIRRQSERLRLDLEHGRADHDDVPGAQPNRTKLDLAALAQDVGLDRQWRQRHRPHQVDGDARDPHRLGVGIASAAQTTKAAGAEPCCMLASQGPAAFGLVATRSPSTR